MTLPPEPAEGSQQVSRGLNRGSGRTREDPMKLSTIRLWAGTTMAGLALSGAALAQEPVTIRIVQTNDIDRMGAEKNRGGFAKLAAVVKEERAKGNAFFVHAGDTLSPSLLSGFDKGAHIIDILNRIGPDAMAPGNHEFDLGPDVFRARMAEAKFDVLATNIIDGNGLPANTKPDKMAEVQWVKFGFFGLTTEDTPIASTPM